MWDSLDGRVPLLHVLVEGHQEGLLLRAVLLLHLRLRLRLRLLLLLLRLLLPPLLLLLLLLPVLLFASLPLLLRGPAGLDVDLWPRGRAYSAIASRRLAAGFELRGGRPRRRKSMEAIWVRRLNTMMDAR